MAYLSSRGITNIELQKEAVYRIPCGEKLVKTCVNDATLVDSNAPRALLICDYRGFITGLAYASKRMK